MAWPNFSVTTAYATLISGINTAFQTVGKLFKDQTTGDYVDQIRYSSSNKRLEYWNGSAWVALDVSSTAITNATNATNATTAASANAIADGAVSTAAKIANNIVTPAKLSRSGTAGQVLTSNGAGADVSYQNAVPAGTVIYSASSTVPAGYLCANGAAVSRTTYANLYAAIGISYGAGDGSSTFNLPDLRGMFLRSLDDGRGIDASRTLGTTQSGQMPSHNHRLLASNGATAAVITVSTGLAGWANGVVGYTAGNNNLMENTGGTTNGGEVRPINVALLACIKY